MPASSENLDLASFDVAAKNDPLEVNTAEIFRDPQPEIQFRTV